MPKIIIICIVLILILSLSGCTSTRAIRSARNRINELEKLNEAGAARNTELGELLESERAGNKEMGILLSGIRTENDKYIEAERNRIEAERLVIDSLTGIFKEGEDLIEGLIRGYNIIREYIEALEVVE